MKAILSTALILVGCAAFAQESNRALQQQEEADRIQREQQELRERARALEKQLETSKKALKKQKELIETLEKTIREIEENGGDAE